MTIQFDFTGRMSELFVTDWLKMVKKQRAIVRDYNSESLGEIWNEM